MAGSENLFSGHACGRPALPQCQKSVNSRFALSLFLFAGWDQMRDGFSVTRNSDFFPLLDVA